MTPTLSTLDDEHQTTIYSSTRQTITKIVWRFHFGVNQRGDDDDDDDDAPATNNNHNNNEGVDV